MVAITVQPSRDSTLIDESIAWSIAATSSSWPPTTASTGVPMFAASRALRASSVDGDGPVKSVPMTSTNS